MSTPQPSHVRAADACRPHLHSLPQHSELLQSRAEIQLLRPSTPWLLVEVHVRRSDSVRVEARPRLEVATEPLLD